MKNTVRICAILMALTMLVSLFAIGIGAADATESYEVVLLLDTSGSMKQSDPTRLSIESARSFATYLPTDADAYLSLITYNTNVNVVEEKLNISESSRVDMNAYNTALDEIAADTGSNWKGLTNIGEAMRQAEAILNKSTATKKAILLFTDGKVEVNSFTYLGATYKDEVTGTHSEADEKCMECARDVAKNLGEQGVRVYCAGLDTSGNNLDKDFLDGLSRVSNGTSSVCSNASEVATLFAKIIADFLGVQSGEGKVISVSPDVETVHIENIYGGVIKEMTVTLICTAEIAQFKVTAPDGTVVVDYDKNTNKNSIKTNLCSVSTNTSNTMISIKLLNRPQDGDWRFSMKSSQPGQLFLNQVYLDDIGLDCKIPTRVGAGEVLALTAQLLNNENGSALNNQRVYENSKMTVEITNLDDNSKQTLYGALDSSKLGFAFNQVMNTCGNFKVACTVSNDQVTKTVVQNVQVVPAIPVLSSSPASVAIGASATLKIEFKSAVTGNLLTSLPSYLKGFSVTVDVMRNDVKVDTITIGEPNYAGGAATYTYTPSEAGNYTFKASLKDGTQKLYDVETANSGFGVLMSYNAGLAVSAGEINCKDGAKISVSLKDVDGNTLTALPATYQNATVMISIFSGESVVDTVTLTAADFVGAVAEYVYKPKAPGSYTVAATIVNGEDTLDAERATVTFVNKEITVADMKLENVKESNFEGTAQKTIDFTGLFTDLEGDTLTYTVSVSDPEAVTATIDGTVLTINALKFTKSTVTITATDAYGATASYTVDVSVKSAVGGLIAWIIVGVILLIGLVVLFFILRKKMIISVAFDVKITESESGDYSVYNVPRLSSRRTSKPTMSLADVLKVANISEGTLDLDRFMHDAADKVILTGMLKKRSFKLKVKGSSTARVFSSRGQVTVSTGGYSVSVGKPYSFVE